MRMILNKSLKLGIVPDPTMSPGSSQPLVYTIRSSVDVSNFSWNDKKTRQGKESPILTRTCLSPLSADGSAAGILFRRLHLYNIERMDSASLCTALSICRSLVDLEIVGLHEADFEPRLIAWKSMDDPSPGDYVHELDYSQGLPQYEVVQVHMRSKKCRSGQWNGVQFVGCSTAPNPAVVPVFVYTETEISFMFEVQDRKLFSIVKLNYLGVTQLLVVNRSRSATWNAMIEFPSDPCDFYGRCGANAICNDSLCGCVKGLLPNSLDEWTVLNFSNGCKRTIPLNCSKGEGFWEIENVKLPDQLEATLYRSMSLEECKDECIGCRMWFGDLIDMRVLEEGNHVQTLYVRQSASKLDAIRDRTRSKIILVAVMLSSIIGGLLLVGTAFWGVKHKKRRIRIGGKSSYRIVSSSQEAIKEFKTRS